MKLIKVIIPSIVLVTMLFSSCRENEQKETVIIKEKVEVQAETTEEREGILERAAKKVDEEVNEEINEEIEKIGDDN